MYSFLNKFKIYLYYFFEIKWRIIYIIFSIINTSIICYFYKDQITYILTNYLLYNMNSHRFIFTDLSQVFFIYIKIVLFVSIIINVPFIILHFLYFFWSSLYLNELKSLIIIIFYILFFYFLSLFITYFIIFPNMLDFFLDFEKKNLYFPLHFEAKIEDFFSIMFLIFFNIILSFQIPVIVYILNYKKIINNFFIIKNRKIFYLFFLLLSALMAPPEIISQLIIYIFILILFEIFILMILFIKNIIV